MISLLKIHFRQSTQSTVKYAVPPALITKTVEVQDEMTVSLVEPLMYGTKAPQAALDEAVKKINKIIW